MPSHLCWRLPPLELSPETGARREFLFALFQLFRFQFSSVNDSNGLNGLNDWNGFSLQPHAIQPVGILAADFALDSRVHSGAQPLQRLVRIRKSRIAVRVVACPHEVFFSENRRSEHACAIVLEREPNMPPHVLSRRSLQLDIRAI